MNCPKCNGIGRIIVRHKITRYRRRNWSPLFSIKTCPVCKGSGEIPSFALESLMRAQE